jgi:hypothetical protein
VLLDQHQVKNLEASVFQWREWFRSLLIIFTVCDANDFAFSVCIYLLHVWLFKLIRYKDNRECCLFGQLQRAAIYITYLPCLNSI